MNLFILLTPPNQISKLLMYLSHYLRWFSINRRPYIGCSRFPKTNACGFFEWQESKEVYLAILTNYLIVIDDKKADIKEANLITLNNIISSA